MYVGLKIDELQTDNLLRARPFVSHYVGYLC